jgi:hypothetical protein
LRHSGRAIRKQAKVKVSQYYVFERSTADATIIKWEPGDDRVIQGLEPVAHLHRFFENLSEHPAFTDPSRSILGVDEVTLFTEKLNANAAVSAVDMHCTEIIPTGLMLQMIRIG